MSRRGWLRGLGRAAGLGSLGLAAALASRKGDADEGGFAGSGSCINRQICVTCGVFRTCDLPAAVSAKRAGR